MRNCVFAFTCMFYAASVHAYIDPGSSLLMLQGVFAFIGGLIVFVRNPVQKLKKFWHRLRRK